MSSIKRLVSASNRIKIEKENQRLIDSNRGNEKELAPTYKVEEVKFDINSRNTKITFIETKHYRTIERHVTQNYVKYPIYSNWKTKTKKFSKSIKLTNSELETLNLNNDSLFLQ